MKVLMFGWEFPPLSSGGLGTACYGLTKSLSGKGAEITFVLPYSNDYQDAGFMKMVPANNIKLKMIESLLKPYMTAESYKTVNIKGKSKPIYGASLFDEVNRYSMAAERIAEEEGFDVVHCHDWMTIAAGIKAKKAKNKPLVLHVHSTEFDRTGGNDVNQHVYEIERHGMHNADKIIAVSNFTKSKIVSHYGVPDDKVEVIHNGVLIDEPVLEKHSAMGDYKIVLFLGRITLQKGPDYFINAAKKVLDFEKDVRFIVAGTGDMERYIIEKAAEMGISDKVMFAGFLNKHEVDRAFKMADVYVMPSVSEPFGITALEAMKNKTPTIISNQCGVSEITKHCLKVDFWDVDAMSSRIISMLRYKALHEALSENSHQEVKKFSWDLPADKCLRIYNQVVKFNS